MGYGCCRTVTTKNATHTIIHTNLIIKIIKTTLYISIVLRLIIYLTYKNDSREMSLHYLCGIIPKCRRHHFGHIATKAVNALFCPKEQDIGHLLPRIRNRTEMITATCWITIIYTIV